MSKHKINTMINLFVFKNVSTLEVMMICNYSQFGIELPEYIKTASYDMPSYLGI